MDAWKVALALCLFVVASLCLAVTCLVVKKRCIEESFTQCGALTVVPYSQESQQSEESQQSQEGVSVFTNHTPRQIAQHGFAQSPTGRITAQEYKALVQQSGRALHFPVKDGAVPLVLYCVIGAPPFLTEAYVRKVLEDLDVWINAVSYGKMFFHIDNVVVRRFTRSTIAEDQRTEIYNMMLAEEAQTRFRFSHIVIFDGYSDTWAGLATTGCYRPSYCFVWIKVDCARMASCTQRQYLDGIDGQKTVLYHELGHTFFLLHSTTRFESSEHKQIFSVMHASSDKTIALDAPQAWFLNFLNVTHIQYETMRAQEVVEVNCMDMTPDRAAVVVTSARGHSIWISYRVPVKLASSLAQDVVLVHNIRSNLAVGRQEALVTHHLDSITDGRTVYVHNVPNHLQTMSRNEPWFISIRVLERNASTGVARIEINKGQL